MASWMWAAWEIFWGFTQTHSFFIQLWMFTCMLKIYLALRLADAIRVHHFSRSLGFTPQVRVVVGDMWSFKAWGTAPWCCHWILPVHTNVVLDPPSGHEFPHKFQFVSLLEGLWWTSLTFFLWGSHWSTCFPWLWRQRPWLAACLVELQGGVASLDLTEPRYYWQTEDSQELLSPLACNCAKVVECLKVW